LIDLLDETAASRALGMKADTLRRWRWERKGPTYCRIGGAIRYRHADLEAFIAKNLVAANG
jgi:hypothetical protein